MIHQFQQILSLAHSIRLLIFKDRLFSIDQLSLAKIRFRIIGDGREREGSLDTSTPTNITSYSSRATDDLGGTVGSNLGD